MTATARFIAIGTALKGATQGKLFGKPCLKINGKAFACFFEEAMVFKLKGEVHGDAFSLDGAQLFDPSAKGRPMKEWVQVPFEYETDWDDFAVAALEYVQGL